MNNLIRGSSYSDNIIAFSLLGPSNILKKEDFRIINQDILIRSDVFIQEEPIGLISNELEITWDSLRLILNKSEGYALISFYNLPFQYKYIFDNVQCFSYFITPSSMYNPLDIRLINKIEVFDSNGAFKDSWEKPANYIYTEQEKEYIDLLLENTLNKFKINDLLEGYIQVNPNNPKEIIIISDSSYIGFPPENIPFYQVMKLSSIESLKLLTNAT